MSAGERASEAKQANGSVLTASISFTIYPQCNAATSSNDPLANRRKLRLGCLVWAKICLQTDCPTLILKDSKVGGDKETGHDDDQRQKVSNDMMNAFGGRDENGHQELRTAEDEGSKFNYNFANDRSSFLIDYVESQLTEFVTAPDSGGQTASMAAEISSLSKAVAQKYSRLSTFDDHAKELHGEAFVQFFLRNPT